MKISNLTKEDVKFLRELKQELNTQDNRMTANPRFYQIQHDIFIPSCNNFGKYFEAVKSGESFGIYAYDEEGLEDLKDVLLADYDEEYSEDVKEINSLTLDNLDNDTIGLKCHAGNYEHIYLNAFLTERACKEYIAANKHHYQNPVDYLNYAFRNPELEKVLEILSKIEIEGE